MELDLFLKTFSERFGYSREYIDELPVESSMPNKGPCPREFVINIGTGRFLTISIFAESTLMA